MGCCNTKAKGPIKEQKRPEQVRKDKSGRPMHRARGEVFCQVEQVYSDMAKMAELACKDPAKFIEMCKRSEVKDFSKYVGYNLAAE